MSTPVPEPRRWTRLSNPVTPTVATFSGGDSATANPFTRLSNPVNATAVGFTPVPALRVALKRHPESDGAMLSYLAAQVIAEVSKLEEACGGHGMHYHQGGSSEEPTRLVLYLLPKLADADAAVRLARVADELNLLARRARSDLIRQQDGDLRERVSRVLRSHPSHAMMSGVDEATVV